MAEYKLKIEIDVEEAKKQLFELAKAMKFPYGSGRGGEQYEATINRMYKVSDTTMSHTKAGADAMARQLFIVQSRNETHRKDFEMEMQRLKFIRNERMIRKVFGGLLGGMGLAGLGKKIIDSSPLLQSVLKLISTAVMFYLRPIGDFIGFVLLPFTLLMLQHAIKFYQVYGPRLMKAAEQFNKGDWVGGLTTIIFGEGGTTEKQKQQAKERWRPGVHKDQQAKRLEDAKKSWADAVKWWEDKWKDAAKWVEDNWPKNISFMTAAFASTGEEVDKAGETLTDFNSIVEFVYNELKKRFTISPDHRKFGTEQKEHRINQGLVYMPKVRYDQLVKAWGKSRTDEYMKKKGYAGVAQEHTGSPNIDRKHGNEGFASSNLSNVNNTTKNTTQNTTNNYIMSVSGKDLQDSMADARQQWYTKRIYTK